MPDDRQTEIRRSLALLTPMKAANRSKVRVGGAADGGYIMLDDLGNSPICYSLGVGPDTSWDVAMAEGGAHVYQYDHTVDGAPTQHANCHFHKIGIGSHDDLADIKRLDTLIGSNGHQSRSDLILKMDIEGSEWDCLDAIDTTTVAQFRQILLELHWLNQLNDTAFRSLFTRVLSKICSSHQSIHVHANNFAGLSITQGIAIPDVCEVSFVRRSNYSFVENDEVFPGPLDAANKPGVPDYFLSQFKF